MMYVTVQTQHLYTTAQLYSLMRYLLLNQQTAKRIYIQTALQLLPLNVSYISSACFCVTATRFGILQLKRGRDASLSQVLIRIKPQLGYYWLQDMDVLCHSLLIIIYSFLSMILLLLTWMFYIQYNWRWSISAEVLCYCRGLCCVNN